MTIDAIRINTSIAGKTALAGTPFTITTSVTNLHDSEIEILEYLYHIPFQVQWIHDVEYTQAYLEKKIDPGTSVCSLDLRGDKRRDLQEK